MNIHNLITERELAEKLGFSSRSILRLRSKRKGPSFIKIGRKYFYDESEVSKWLTQHQVEINND